MEAPEEKRTPHSDITSFLILSNNHFAWRLGKNSLPGKFRIDNPSQKNYSAMQQKEMEALTNPFAKEETFVKKFCWLTAEPQRLYRVAPRGGQSFRDKKIAYEVGLRQGGFDNTEVIFGEKQITAEDGSRKVLYTVEYRAGEEPSSLFFRHQRVLPGTIDLKSFEKGGPTKSVDLFWDDDGNLNTLKTNGLMSTALPEMKASITVNLVVLEWSVHGQKPRAVFQSFNCLPVVNLLHLVSQKIMSLFYYQDLRMQMNPKKDHQSLDDWRSSVRRAWFEKLLDINNGWGLKNSYIMNLKALLEKVYQVSYNYLHGNYRHETISAQDVHTARVKVRDLPVGKFIELAVSICVFKHLYNLLWECQGSVITGILTRLRKSTKQKHQQIVEVFELLVAAGSLLPPVEDIEAVLLSFNERPLTGFHRAEIEATVEWCLRLSKIRISTVQHDKISSLWTQVSADFNKVGLYLHQHASTIFDNTIWFETSPTELLIGAGEATATYLTNFVGLAQKLNAKYSYWMKRTYFRHMAGSTSETVPLIQNQEILCKSQDQQPAYAINLRAFSTETVIPMGRYLLLFYRSSGTQHTLIDTYTGRSVLVEPFPIANGQPACVISYLGDSCSGIRRVCHYKDTQKQELAQYCWTGRPKKERFEEVYHTPGAKLSMKELFSDPFQIQVTGNNVGQIYNTHFDWCTSSLLFKFQRSDLKVCIQIFQLLPGPKFDLVTDIFYEDIWNYNPQLQTLLKRSMNMGKTLERSNTIIHNSMFLLHVSPHNKNYSQDVCKVDLVSIELRTIGTPQCRFSHTSIKLPYSGCKSEIRLFRGMSHSQFRGIRPNCVGLYAVSLQTPQNSATLVRVTVFVVHNRTGVIETLFDSSPAFHRRLQQSLESVGLYDTHPDNLLVVSDAEHRQHNEKQKHLNVYFCGMGYTQKSGAGLSMFERLQRTILVSRVRINL